MRLTHGFIWKDRCNSKPIQCPEYPAGANTAIGILETAGEQVATYRAYVGALQNRLVSAVAALTARSQNQLIAKGRIEDADYAQEIAKLNQSQLLQNAGIE